MSDAVCLVGDVQLAALESLLGRFDLNLCIENEGAAISGSFWGDSEAGIIGRNVYVRNDTPIHSLLHEACHIICMTAERREKLDRDAGGSDLEEAAVCYLQIKLADQISGVGSERLMRDMDAWGYSFRLGSTLQWFEADAEDALAWLLRQGLIYAGTEPTFRLRD